eukprot:TRINITY_DN74912_c0_g1_i1.p1 TRINITY_DN74912_c0_g1~~TRINITY_DN74912_c0_g1_i1.p1  ORF type:complete len:355 (-),score=42.92 TRINITY_DN74912_c0_g1_i1:78-1100(-)
MGKVMQWCCGGGAVAAIVVGTRLGLYGPLKEKPHTVESLCAATGIDADYARYWLFGQKAYGILQYDEKEETFALPESWATVLATPGNPAFMAPYAGVIAGAMEKTSEVCSNVKAGTGFPWKEVSPIIQDSTRQAFEVPYTNLLVQNWLPGIPGAVEKLQNGAVVADIGCGHGVSSCVLGKAFPKSQIKGYDYCPVSIAKAQEIAKQREVTNVEFLQEDATKVAGQFDMVFLFDCFHDMADPAGVAKGIFNSLKDDGVVMLVEPGRGGDNFADQKDEVSGMFFGVGVYVCQQISKAGGGPALGPCCPTPTLKKFWTDAGFEKFERATCDAPMNRIWGIWKK